jgi:hypothetical protein
LDDEMMIGRSANVVVVDEFGTRLERVHGAPARGEYAYRDGVFTFSGDDAGTAMRIRETPAPSIVDRLIARTAHLRLAPQRRRHSGRR